jgi:hypothetical protein
MDMFAVLNDCLFVTQLQKLDVVRMLTDFSLVTRPDAFDGKWGNVVQGG